MLSRPMVAMVVDDDPLVRRVAEFQLRQLGASKVLAVADAAAALAAFQSEDRVHLLVCDLQMPEADGVSVIKMLCRLDGRLPVLIMSSAQPALLAEARDEVAACGAKVVGTIQKPVTLDGLRPFVSKILGRDDGPYAPSESSPG